ncbi:UNVERIFIED_CONTAM: hypothetical protein RMT77_005047 [Armadillidium vulgare]
MDAEILKLGKELGLKGKELIDFFKESQTRAAAEAEKARAEARAEAEKARAEARAEAEKVRAHEIKMLELQNNNNRNNRRIENFELTPFIDGEDDIYRYVEDFEYYAQINKWNPNNWGIYLATFLTGNALGIYARMPSNEANDYYKLKCALLPKFYNTEVKCRLMKEERNIDDKDNLEIEFVKSKHEIVVSHPASLNESFQQMISSQESPIKGEDSFPQPETFAEKELPSSQDMIFLPTSSKWENNEDDISSLYKTSAEQDEEEENLVTSNVIKRTENALSSKELSNGSLISRKVYMEKNKEKEIESRRTPISEWGKVDTQEAKKKGFSIQITISSKTESQIERPRIGKSEFESENEVPSTALDGKSVVEKDREESKYDLHIVKSRDRYLCNEKKAVKKSWLDCEEVSQSFLLQNKRNSKDSNQQRVKIQKNNFSSELEMWDEKKFYVKVDPKSDDNLPKYFMENQDSNISSQRGTKKKKEYDINVSPKFSKDHIDVFIEEIVNFQVGEDNRFNSQSKEENKQMINESYAATPHKEINTFKINHEDGNSIESSNIVVVSESVYENEDTKIETSSYLSLSSSSSSSSSFSSSFSNSVEENRIKRKKKMKMNERKRKRKGDDDNNDDGINILNYKSNRRTTSKRSANRIRQLKLYKYRRKGKIIIK